MSNQSLINAWVNLNVALRDSNEYNDKTNDTPLYLTPIMPKKISTNNFRPQSAALPRHTRKDRPDSSHKHLSIRLDTTPANPSVRPSSSQARVQTQLVRSSSADRNSRTRITLLSTDNPNFSIKRPTSSTAQRGHTIRPFFSAQTPAARSHGIPNTISLNSVMLNTSTSSPLRKSSSALRISEAYGGRYSSGDPDQLVHSVTLGELAQLFRAKCADTNVEFNPSQLPTFFEKFRKSSKRRTLQLDNQSFGPQCGIVMAEILAHNRHFSKINLGKNFISDAGAAAFADALRTNDMIIELDLTSNNISYKGAALLFDALSTNQTVIAFNIQSEEGLNRNKLDSRGAKPLADLLKKNRVLQFLSLKGLCIDALGASFICSGLENNPTLVFLDLSWNEIGPALCKSLVQALPICALLELNIAGNKIGDNGVNTLSNVFWSTMHNITKLQKLDLSDNRLTWQGVTRLMDSLSQNQTVETLILDNNYLGGRASICLVNFLWENFTLKRLSMVNCQLELDACTAIASGLERNSSLQALHLSKNFLTSKGAEILAAAFVSKSGIEEFELQSCSIRDEGGVALALAIKVNTNIQRVNLRDNNLYDDSGAAMVEAAINNKKLRQLLLDRNPMSLKHSLEIQRRILNNNHAKAKGRTSVYERKINELKEFELQKYAVNDEQMLLDLREHEIKEEIKFEHHRFEAHRKEEMSKYNELEDKLNECTEKVREVDNFRKDLEKEIATTQLDFQNVKNSTINTISEVVQENHYLESEIKRMKDGMKLGRVTLHAKKEQLNAELQYEIKVAKTLEAAVASTQKEVTRMSAALEAKMMERQKTMSSNPEQEQETSLSPVSPKKVVTNRKSMINLAPKRSISADKLTVIKRNSVGASPKPRKSNLKVGK